MSPLVDRLAVWVVFSLWRYAARAAHKALLYPGNHSALHPYRRLQNTTHETLSMWHCKPS
jgi:hypothetical protein